MRVDELLEHAKRSWMLQPRKGASLKKVNVAEVLKIIKFDVGRSGNRPCRRATCVDYR
jgi:hypothetical protein